MQPFWFDSLTKARCNYWLNESDFAKISRYKEKRWDLRCLYSSGGVPSSHSATVMGLAVAIGLGDGLGGPLLAIAFVLASVVCLFTLLLFVPHTKDILTYFYGVITSELHLLTCYC
jgi:membrane-associated phospholipid phosphatase